VGGCVCRKFCLSELGRRGQVVVSWFPFHPEFQVFPLFWEGWLGNAIDTSSELFAVVTVLRLRLLEQRLFVNFMEISLIHNLQRVMTKVRNNTKSELNFVGKKRGTSPPPVTLKTAHYQITTH